MFRPVGVCNRGTNLVEAVQNYEAEKCPYKKTNGDRIRAMSDEELMQFLFNEVSNNTICSFCVPTMRTKCKCDGHCKNGILEWLKQPAEVNDV